MAMFMRVEGLQVKLLAPELTATTWKILTTLIIKVILLMKGPKLNLMFFWPCIMNWLYINYQLDALIIIYS